MAKVAAASGARDLDSAHAEAEILVKLDGFPSDWLEEAGPAGARVVLCLGTEQFRSARRAAIVPRSFVKVSMADHSTSDSHR